MGLLEIQRLKDNAKLPKQKKVYTIPKVSEKRKKQNEEQKSLIKPDEDNAKEAWFKARRKELVGVCQCGCGSPSQKKDDMYFRHSIAHIFPKKDFESVKYHPLNYVERAFWGGCHTNMDEQGLDKWMNFADFEDIKEKFFVLSQLLTEEEKALKFYTQLEKLVYQNPY